MLEDLLIRLFCNGDPDPFDSFQVDFNDFKDIIHKACFIALFRDLSFKFKNEAGKRV